MSSFGRQAQNSNAESPNVQGAGIQPSPLRPRSRLDIQHGDGDMLAPLLKGDEPVAVLAGLSQSTITSGRHNAHQGNIGSMLSTQKLGNAWMD